MKILCHLLLSFTSLLLLNSCNKFLSEKSDKRLVTPTRLKDLQALLDHSYIISANMAAIGERSSDDYYLEDATYDALSSDYMRNIYTWKGEQLYPLDENDWDYTYKTIYIANLVLLRLEDIPRTSTNALEWDHIKGQALAIRSFRYLSAAGIWAKAYNAETAKTDLGLPLRQTEDFNEPSVRVSVAETYQQITRSLEEAIPLLPVHTKANTRIGKPAAYTLLARTWLFMREYEKAGRYADSALLVNRTLLDYNSITNDKFPYAESNPEIMFSGTGNYDYNGDLLEISTQRIDSTIYQAFDDHDLRKTLFFQENLNGTHSFKGNYSGSSSSKFFGIANSEAFLIRAECLARAGKVTEAMQILNELLVNRYNKNLAFQPLTAGTKEEAVKIILLERRKEMLFRGVRWPDIKRLNLDGANIVLKRKIHGQEYILSPNDNRYAIGIPEDVIQLSGMPQNER